jgi:alkyl hydroperoxide reductase subunit AhpC
VCTTELGEVARQDPEFRKRGVKVIGISANGLDEHHKWVQDINEYGQKFGPTDVQFPIVSGRTSNYCAGLIMTIHPDSRR